MSKINQHNAVFKAREVAQVASPFAIVRLDGRGFSGFTQTYFRKPVDQKFHNIMIACCEAIFEHSGINVSYVQYHSDEISILISNADTSFGRNVQKYTTLLASLVSSVFTSYVSPPKPIMFDGRLHQANSADEVIAYFKWRQTDAVRNALNNYCYWTLRNSGKTNKQADSLVRTMKGDPVALKELIKVYSNRKEDYDALEGWITNVTGFYRSTIPHVGYNPIEQCEVTVDRSALMRVDNIPAGSGYNSFISGVIRDVI
jgi:tRNA(His) 5'-end guanylyltransferase